MTDKSLYAKEKIEKYLPESKGKIIERQFQTNDLTFLELRDSLIGSGRIIEEDEESETYVVEIKAGIGNMNPAMVSMCIEEGMLVCFAYAKEGKINQNTASNALDKIPQIIGKIEKNTKEEKNTKPLHRKRGLIVLLSMLIIVVVGVLSFYISRKNHMNELAKEIKDYNEMVQEYNSAVKNAYIEGIDGMPSELPIKGEIDTSFSAFMSSIAKTNDQWQKEIDSVQMDIQNGLAEYIILEQINNPTEEMVKNKIGQIESITGFESVSEGNDPNEMLGKEGGYTACVYFSIDNQGIHHKDNREIIAEGTEGGGAIEVFKSKDDALARDEYLKDFNDTYLYAGSSLVLGTMVIRTSRFLSGEEQRELTNKIVDAFLSA